MNLYQMFKVSISYIDPGVLRSFFIFAALFFCSTVLFSQTVVNISIDTSNVIETSRFNLGITHTHKTWENSSMQAADRAKKLIKESCRFQNQHIMGWGAANPNPSPGVFSWNSLDSRMNLLRSLNAEIILTFCTAPGWMKVSGSDWDMESKVKDASIGAFADLCKKIALRYPDVKYFQIWNELKGYWNPSLNNWDYVSYSNLYNAIWDSVKSVRSDALLGGPYIVLQGDGSAEIGKTGTDNYTPIGSRDMKFLTEWWSRKKGADFVCFDRSLKDYHNSVFLSKADKMELTKHFGLVVKQLRTVVGKNTPVFISEFYGGTDPSDLSFTAANYASCYLHSILNATNLALVWNPEQGELEGYLYTNTQLSTGGQPVEHYYVFKNINTYFSESTDLVNAISSNPSVEVLASASEVMIVNKNPSDVIVNLMGNILSLKGYEVRFADLTAISLSSGVSANQKLNPFSVFSFQDKVWIKSIINEQIWVRIYNINGQSLFTSQFNISENEIKEIYCSNSGLPLEVIFVEIFSNKKIFQAKILL